MEVALIGGSFNPPHIGHLVAAHYVRATQPVDKVWLMPSFRHPFGKALTPFEHRVRMCQAICRDTSGWLEVSEVEQEIGGEGRTVDTLAFLHARHPDVRFTFVIGSDILPDLPRWKDFPRIQTLARVLVLQRAGYPAPEAFGPPLVEVSSTQIRDQLARGELPVELVPRVVLQYAQAHGLYGLAAAATDTD